MKVSVKLQDPQQNNNHHSPPLLIHAKVPITILNLPFLSHFSTTTTHPSDLSLALSTNFTSGPSLKLSYATTSSAASAATTPPLTLSLKSGSGIFGSPKNSPLVISAHFSFNPSNTNNPNPTFSLLFKPQLGSFSLRKSTFSHSKSDVSSDSTNVDAGLDSSSFGFVPLERSVPVKDLSLEKNEKDSILKGTQLTANTHIPVAHTAALNLRWWMDFPVDKMPVLRINKIGIERIDKVVRGNDEKKRKDNESSMGELEMLKGMCFWMKRDLDSMAKMNKEMKYELVEMKGGLAARNGGGGTREIREGVLKKAMPAVGKHSGGFEEWRSKKDGRGEENGNVNSKKEENKNNSLAIDVESELQKAIKAASSSP